MEGINVTEKMQEVLEGVIRRLRENEDIWMPGVMAWDVERGDDVGNVECLDPARKYKHGIMGLVSLTIKEDVEWVSEKVDHSIYLGTLVKVAGYLSGVSPEYIANDDASKIISSWESREPQHQDGVIRLLDCMVRRKKDSK